MHSLCASIETPDYISWRSISTLGPTVPPLMFASLPADRTSTRGICFVDFNRSGQFVVKLFNNSAISGGGNALRLPVRGWKQLKFSLTNTPVCDQISREKSPVAGCHRKQINPASASQIDQNCNYLDQANCGSDIFQRLNRGRASNAGLIAFLKKPDWNTGVPYLWMR